MNTTAENLIPLKEAIKDYYSRPRLNEQQIANLMSLQNKCTQQKEDQIIWGSLIASVALVLPLIYSVL